MEHYELASSVEYEEGGFELRRADAEDKVRPGERRTGWLRRACCVRTCPGAAPVALWRACAAELCGTALLLLLSCVPACAAPPGPAAPLVARALCAGLVVASLVQALDHVSGAQLNPTVTLAAALARRVSSACGVALAAAQLVGAALGACALAALTGDARACLTNPASHISDFQALALETLLGACLALVNLAAWDARNSGLRDSWPLRVGFTVAALSFVAADLTGASMNPARSLAPALVCGHWGSLWVYVLGPLSGAALAAGLYAVAWRAPAPPGSAPAPRKLPLSP